ncbi:MAG: putative Ig domain-containing protein [Ignavibacteriaceae bacterium]|jgi:hypothetical protein
MQKIVRLLLVVTVLIVSSMSLYAQAIPPDSLYLGQTPPGDTPKIFNLAINRGSFAAERIAISNDNREIYFSEVRSYYPAAGDTIKYYSYSGGNWKGPFNLFGGYLAPALSVSGDTMYFQNANIQNSSSVYETFISVKNGPNWGSPQRILSNLNSAHYLQVTNNGNYYISSISNPTVGASDWCKLLIDGVDTSAISLGQLLNSGGDNLDFFISKDETFIILAKGGLQISYRKNDGSWTNPKSLGSKINFGLGMWGPYVSPDNKYLFYTTGTKQDYSDTYVHWVRIDELIDSLRHTNFTPYLKNQIKNQIDTVGHSFNFTIPDSTFFDDDGNSTLTISAKLSNGAPWPSWLSFNPGTRTFSGIPTAAKVFPIMVTVTAKDTANASASATFGITIVANPVGVEEINDQLPKDINLYQNYPNPFNPTTTIEFAIPKTGKYTLGLYNALGQLVKEISDEEYEAGNYKETFNATGLSSGMYIYRLTGNDANIVRKMVFLR